MIVNHWGPEFTELYGHYFPDTYLCWDTEYTGGNAQKDLIMEIGHCMVREGQVVDQKSFVLDWSQHPEVPNDWIRKRLKHQALQMGDRWRVTWDVMQAEGIHPVKVLRFYFDLFKTWSKQHLPFVAHNGYHADERMFAGNVEGFLVKRFAFHDNELIDTGAIHKASLILDSVDPLHEDLKIRVLPQPGDTMRSYFTRVATTPAKGIFWKMLDCLEYYGLDEKFDLDLKSLHTADYDSYCCHLLMEEFGSRVTHNHGPGSGIDTPEQFARTWLEEEAKAKLQRESGKRKTESFEGQAAHVKVDPEARKRLQERRDKTKTRRRKQRPV